MCQLNSPCSKHVTHYNNILKLLLLRDSFSIFLCWVGIYVYLTLCVNPDSFQYDSGRPLMPFMDLLLSDGSDYLIMFNSRIRTFRFFYTESNWMVWNILFRSPLCWDYCLCIYTFFSRKWSYIKNESVYSRCCSTKIFLR